MDSTILFDQINVRGQADPVDVIVSFETVEVEETDNILPVEFLVLKGQPGAGITNMTYNTTTKLITVTLDNGETYDVGPIDAIQGIRGETGPQGATGPQGPAGADGTDGNGIVSIVQNQDYSLTITMDDGMTYTTDPVRGPQGPQGATGAAGVGISSVTLNSDYTLTVAFTDGTSYTTPSIRGAQGETGATGQTGAAGVGISSITQNADYTLTINLTNGTSYTTTAIRGEQGPQGPQGDSYILTNQDKQDIADIVSAEISGDTGWVDQTINSNSKLSSGSFIQCRRIGKIVNVRGMIVANSNFANQNEVTVSTIDADFRPSGIVRFEAGAYDQLWTISIGTDGSLIERNSSGTAPGGTKSNRFNVTYFVD